MDERIDYPKAEAALIALRQIIRATEINSRAVAKASGLTPSQFIVMRLLSRDGAVIPSVLAKHLSLSQATVTSLLDKLETKGFVRRERDVEDKRRVMVHLTQEGEERINTAPGVLQQRFETKFAELEEWEKSFLVTALERLALMLDATEIDADPVLDVGDIFTLTE